MVRLLFKHLFNLAKMKMSHWQKLQFSCKDSRLQKPRIGLPINITEPRLNCHCLSSNEFHIHCRNFSILSNFRFCCYCFDIKSALVLTTLSGCSQLMTFLLFSPQVLYSLVKFRISLRSKKKPRINHTNCNMRKIEDP